MHQGSAVPHVGGCHSQLGSTSSPVVGAHSSRYQQCNCQVTLCWFANSLRGVILHSAGVDDTAIAPIAQLLQHLTELQLAGTAVTDAGVAQLTALRQLRRLTAPDAVTLATRNLVVRQ
jgi:hypothetical protein